VDDVRYVSHVVAGQVQLRRQQPRRAAVETPAHRVGEVRDAVVTQVDVAGRALGASERPRFQLRQSIVAQIDVR